VRERMDLEEQGRERPERYEKKIELRRTA